MRASSLNIANYCSGAPALLKANPIRRTDLSTGILVHEFLEIWIVHSYAVAVQWLADGERDELIPELTRFIAHAREELPELVRGKCEVPMVLHFDGIGEVTGRLDWIGPFSSADSAADPTPHDQKSMSEGSTIHVIDWKHGAGQPYYLPPLDEDLQLLVYGLMAVAHTGADRVVIHRALVSVPKIETWELAAEQIRSATEWIKAVVSDVESNPDTRRVGPHCGKCLARDHCPEYVNQIMEVAALIPSDPAPIVLSRDQAERYARARDAIKGRLEVLDQALHEYLQDGGYIKRDDQWLRSIEYEVDRVKDHQQIMTDLIQLVGGHASGAVRLQKSGIRNALQLAGWPVQSLAGLLEHWREEGAIVRDKRRTLRWKKDNG